MRYFYIRNNGKKFILHEELLLLLFITYILLLFELVTSRDVWLSGTNLIPFKEILRYPVGSTNFYRQVIGNIVLFIPFGFFASYYTKTSRLGTIAFIILGFLIFVALDAIKRKLPKFLQRDGFYNFLSILLVIFVALYLTGIIKLW